MNQLPDEISFERWVKHVFDHPIVDPAWYFHVDDEYEEEWRCDALPERTLEYITRLFREPRFLLSEFSHVQIDQGLTYIISPDSSNHMFLIRDESLPLNDRLKCIRSMKRLYSDLFGPMYGNQLGHWPRTGGDDSSNYICYMLWDVIPVFGGLKHPEIDQINNAILDVFESTLKLRSEACLESVLHGCGHWYLYIPDRIAPMVRNFLKTCGRISPELRQYAEAASRGLVQ